MLSQLSHCEGTPLGHGGRPSRPIGEASVSQYVVVNESILPFEGHENVRTYRSMQPAMSGSDGFVETLTPAARPNLIATLTVTFIRSGAPHSPTNAPLCIGPAS